MIRQDLLNYTPSYQAQKMSRLRNKQQQTKRKLQKIQSPYELQKIYNAMKSQNTLLLKDIGILKQHLFAIQQKQKLKSSRITIKNDSINKDEHNFNQIQNISDTKSVILNQNNQNKVIQASKLQTQLQKHKKQLEQQYKIMKYLKKSIQNKQKQLNSDQFNQQRLKYKNKFKEIELQVKRQSQRKLLLIKDSTQLESTLKKNQKDSTPNQNEIAFYNKENQQLKKKLAAFIQEGHKVQYQARWIVDQIYQKKGLLTEFQPSKNSKGKGNTLLSSSRNSIINKISQSTKLQNSFFNDKNKLTSIPRSRSISNNLTHQQTSPIKMHKLSMAQPQNDSNLAEQITELKNQVEQISKASIKQASQYKKQKQALIQFTRKQNNKLKQLQKTKTKKVVQLNHLKAKIINIAKQKQMREKTKIHLSNFGIQENQFDVRSIKDPLRRDFAGIISGKLKFDDRAILREKKKTFIKGLIVYQNDNNLSMKGSLVAIRAIYTDQQTNLLNFLPIPGQYLHKCKITRLQLPEDDFIKLFKVKYNMQQTRVSKIQVRSNKNHKYQFGQKKPIQEVSVHETIYAFDIGMNQYPVSMFGSFCQFRNCWYLESIGVEIGILGN